VGLVRAGMADRSSAVELLAAGINALAHVDAGQLGGLAVAARGAGWPQTSEEQRAARQGLRTMELLLTLTRRNLRLLRGARHDGYGLSTD
jgi:hypothetical protein